MDKILFLGNNLHVDTLIKIAKDRGIYSIVTDNLAVEDSPVKKMADEYWDISVTDIDAIEEKAKAEGVTAILCGASEVCMGASRELCKRLGFPFYVTDEAWEIVNNKQLFKAECTKYGVPVARDFKLDINLTTEDLAAIEYPVVVKPVDGCSSIGLHICFDEAQLIAGYKDAYEKSDAKEVVVEKFLSGEEVSLLFCFVNGEPILIETGDVLGDKKGGRPFLFGGTPTKHMALIKDKLEEPLKKLFAGMGCKAGVGSIQFIIEDEEVAVIEMNYRLPGAKTMSSEFICNRMIDYVVGEVEDKEKLISAIPPIANTKAYCVWVNPGTISEINGLEMLKEKLHTLSFNPNYRVGDTIPENSGMRQIFLYAVLDGNKEDLSKAADFINDNLEVLDENGVNLICKYHYDNKGCATAIN
ncbi:MAG: ATP-grasp domain-containing protein [Pseudobutyrivibrio sp.]|nr:ATP-grasp domain-containing protein [Pseudobutyrivibrio sp.]